MRIRFYRSSNIHGWHGALGMAFVSRSAVIDTFNRMTPRNHTKITWPIFAAPLIVAGQSFDKLFVGVRACSECVRADAVVILAHFRNPFEVAALAVTMTHICGERSLG